MQTTEPTTRRGLVRRPTHRWIAGVAGGLADATGTNAAWWRLGFVLLTLVGGAGVAIYLILWIVLPRADRPRSAGQRIVGGFPGLPGWAGVLLLGFGMLLLLGHLWPSDLVPPYVRPPFAHRIRTASPGFALAVLLIGVGMLLFRKEGERDTEGRSMAIAGSAPAGDVPPPPPVARGPRRPRPPRERSMTGWLSFGLALAAVGVAWLLANTGAGHLSLTQMLALPLAIIGGGLLLGSIFGRARWTILLGIPLIPLVLASSLIPTPITGRYDDRYVTPRTAAQVQTNYEQSGGTVIFNLTKLRRGEHPAPIYATIGIGNIQVVVPKGTPVDITASVGLGSIVMLSGNVNGLGVSEELHRGGVDPIVMTLESGIGNVYVYYEPTSRPKKPQRPHGGNG